MGYKLLKTFISVLLCFYSIVKLEADYGQLQVGFYEYSCGEAEYIVKDEVRKAFNKDNGMAAGLVRMHFHDCFVRARAYRSLEMIRGYMDDRAFIQAPFVAGCDGSVLINSTGSIVAEKDSPINNPSLRGFEVIDNAKARLEYACKGVVSCADIVAFAARDSIEITKGLGYDVPAGRRDGRISLASDTITNLPFPTFNLAQLTQLFANKSLTQDEMVTLSGAHTLGRSHCTSFINRLYNFSSNASQDPTLDPTYAAQLKQVCPQGSNPILGVVPMDPTPAVADVAYYQGVLANRGLFTSDQTLLTSPQTLAQIRQNVKRTSPWKNKFAAAMVKMGNIDVLTGNAGEIRANCRVING